MTLNIVAFRAWLKECEDALKIIHDPALYFDRTKLILFERAVRPYHYYLQEWEKNHDGGGRESGIENESAGATRTTTAAPNVGADYPHAAANTAPISVRIRGDTKPHKDRLRTQWHLRWDPKEKMWYGKMPSERQKDFLAAMKEMKLEVVA